MTYSEKLKDPRWQKKRLMVLERDEWACQCCGDREMTLHVHHNEYEYGKEPWETENILLTTLCEKCHGERHESINHMKELKVYLNQVIKGYKKDRFDFKLKASRIRYLFGLFMETLFDKESKVLLGKDFHFVIDSFLDSAGLKFVCTKIKNGKPTKRKRLYSNSK